MQLSKKAEYALRAVVGIANNMTNRPIQISELSKKESIPIKFLEQILLILKNNGILKSKRGANGGYLLGRSSSEITIGKIIYIIEGSFDPLGIEAGNQLGVGLTKCFKDLNKMVSEHLDTFTIQDIIELDQLDGRIAFEI